MISHGSKICCKSRPPSGLRSPCGGERLCASRLVEPSSSVTLGAAGAPARLTDTQHRHTSHTPDSHSFTPNTRRGANDGLLAALTRLSSFPRAMTVLGRVIVSTHCLINFVNVHPLLPWKCSMTGNCDAKNHRHLPGPAAPRPAVLCVVFMFHGVSCLMLYTIFLYFH